MRKRRSMRLAPLALLALGLVLAGCAGEHQQELTAAELQVHQLRADDPVGIVHWFHLHHLRPGLWHLLHGDRLYLLATYDESGPYDLVVESALVEPGQVTVRAVTGDGLEVADGAAGRPEGYSSTIYVLGDIEPLRVRTSPDDPHTIIIER